MNNTVVAGESIDVINHVTGKVMECVAFDNEHLVARSRYVSIKLPGGDSWMATFKKGAWWTVKGEGYTDYTFLQ